jgi:N-acetylmuramoyl-L-alanine amidase
MRKLEKKNVKYIVVHCSATMPGQPCDAEMIDQWHRARGFELIGYHYVVMPDGNIEHGRPLFYQGAHVRNYNAVSIGVCYVGGLDAQGTTADTRTPQQKETLTKLLAQLQARYPKARIVGHRDLDRGKACPCYEVKS